MTPREMAMVLKGSAEEKRNLFDQMISRVCEGEQLSDNEVPIFEALKKELMIKSEIVTMSASVQAAGGIADV